jgi:hypothetical protein
MKSKDCFPILVRHSVRVLSKIKVRVSLAQTGLWQFLLLLSLASCADLDNTLPEYSQPGLPVEVRLQLSASQETDATPTESGLSVTTRAVDDDDASPYAQIKNVWILQFDGQTDAAPLTGVPIYIADYEVEDNRVCALVTGINQTVWFLANTFDPSLHWDANLTLGALKTRYMPITGEASLHGRGNATATPGAGYPSDADYYLIMNGVWQENINSNTSLKCPLHRNTVRLDFRLKNTSSGASTVSVDSVTLLSTMRRQFFYNSYVLSDMLFPSEQDIVFNNYEAAPFTGGVVDGDYTCFRFYLPANQRGANAAVASEWEKNRQAPYGATSIRVYAHYMEGTNTVSVTYTFYPGANLTTDYNLKPDHSYTLNVEINGPGDPATDPRVQSMGVRNFAAPGEERANCYMLNPNPAGTRLFRIPVDRINLFWGGHGYANVHANTLGANTRWEAQVLWSDFTPQDNDPAAAGYFKLVKAAGAGPEGDKDGYFTVELGSQSEGNVLVAVKKADGGDILWSWHLWITDYDPYQGTLSGAMNAIPVPGGVYMRGTGCATLPNGKYQGVMDRCLGSNSPSQRPPIAYQFGRKDPFYMKPDNTKQYTYPQGYYTDAETVQNPTTAIYTTYVDPAGSYWYANTVSEWKEGQRYRDSRIEWNYDTRIEWNDVHTIYNYTEGVTKSLFDPCPPGWKVPRSSIGSWVAVTTNTTLINLPTDVGVVLFYGLFSEHGANYPGYTDTSWAARRGVRLRRANNPNSSILGQPYIMTYDTQGLNNGYSLWVLASGAGGLVPVLAQRMAH